MVAQRCQMLGGSGSNFSGNAAEPLLDQLTQRPACTVTGKHGHIMDMHITVFMGICDLIVINFAQPIVCGDCAGVGKNQTADRIGDGRVFLDAPILHLDIAVNQLFIVQNGGFHVTELLALTTIENVGLCHIVIACTAQNRFHTVLNILHGDLSVFHLCLKVSRYLECKKVDNIVVILLFLCVKRFFDGG